MLTLLAIYALLLLAWSTLPALFGSRTADEDQTERTPNAAAAPAPGTAATAVTAL